MGRLDRLGWNRAGTEDRIVCEDISEFVRTYHNSSEWKKIITIPLQKKRRSLQNL